MKTSMAALVKLFASIATIYQLHTLFGLADIYKHQ